jgi:uroporphyrinogen-III synthase
VRADLAGERVLVTRAAHQAGDLADAFRAVGARVEFLPLIEIGPPADPAALERAAAEAMSYDWLVLTSTNAAEAFLPLLSGQAPRIAAVGPATAAAIRDAGFQVDATAVQADAEGLVELLGAGLLGVGLGPGSRFLLPQADDARATLGDGLRAAGAEVLRVDAYSKRLPPASRQRAAELFADGPLGWVTFTSPRITDHFFALLDELLEDELLDDGTARRSELRAIAIGRLTLKALDKHGVRDAVMAEEPTPEAMVRAALSRLAEPFRQRTRDRI